MTNYSFFSAILEKSFFSTTRWHIFDGTDYPQKNNKYFTSYKNLLINAIKRNNVEVIYTIDPVKNSNIYDYIDKNCFDEKQITEILTRYPFGGSGTWKPEIIEPALPENLAMDDKTINEYTLIKEFIDILFLNI